jgi:hypothetical protein
MTVRIQAESMIYKSNPLCKIYIELMSDMDSLRVHLTNKSGDHLDGYYLFSIDRDYDNCLKLWTSVGPKIKDMVLVGRSQLKIAGVDMYEEL